MAIAFVQGNCATGSVVTTLTSADLTTTTGNLFVIGFGFENNTFVSIVDSKSNTLQTSLANTAVPSTSETMGERYVNAGTMGSGHNATLTMNANSFIQIMTTEISGQDASTSTSAFEALGALAGNGFGTSVTSGSASAAGNALLLGTGWSNVTPTPSSPFTTIATSATAGTGWDEVGAGSYTVTFTATLSSLGCFMTVWKEAAAAASTRLLSLLGVGT